MKLYQADAFTEDVFSGNPAAVVPLQEWLPDEVMQNIAMENNLSETAFFIPVGDDFHIRWFTPSTEVNLCGHATLAAAHVLFMHLGYDRKTISFQSISGLLKVNRKDNLIILDFPASDLSEAEFPDQADKLLGIMPEKCIKGSEDLMMVFSSEEDLQNLQPDYDAIARLNYRGLIATAPSKEFDFVSRFFAPAVGVNEDPVTGSAHTLLIPYWAERLHKTEMIARQVSKRGGIIHCRYRGERVDIGGYAATYLIGDIFV
jgi:PhzF family phenazine biosynthesis protein